MEGALEGVTAKQRDKIVYRYTEKTSVLKALELLPPVQKRKQLTYAQDVFSNLFKKKTLEGNQERINEVVRKCAKTWLKALDARKKRLAREQFRERLKTHSRPAGIVSTRHLHGQFQHWVEKYSKEAAEAFQEQKYAKAEYYLCQLLTVCEHHNDLLKSRKGEPGLKAVANPEQHEHAVNSAHARPESASASKESQARAGSGRKTFSKHLTDETAAASPGADKRTPTKFDTWREREFNYHLDVAPVLYRLGQVLNCQNRVQEAEWVVRQGLDGLEIEEGVDDQASKHKGVKYRLLTELSKTCLATRPFSDTQALQYATRALRIAESVYGASHSMMADPLARVADCLCRHTHYAEAAEFLERAHLIRARTHGDRHPETGRVLCSLAAVFKRMGKFERADRYDKMWRMCHSQHRVYQQQLETKTAHPPHGLQAYKLHRKAANEAAGFVSQRQSRPASGQPGTDLRQSMDGGIRGSPDSRFSRGSKQSAWGAAANMGKFAGKMGVMAKDIKESHGDPGIWTGDIENQTGATITQHRVPKLNLSNIYDFADLSDSEDGSH